MACLRFYKYPVIKSGGRYDIGVFSRNPHRGDEAQAGINVRRVTWLMCPPKCAFRSEIRHARLHSACVNTLGLCSHELAVTLLALMQ